MSMGMLKTRSPFCDSHHSVSPEFFRVEELEERITQNDSEVCGDSPQGQGEPELAKFCAYNDAVSAGHALAVCGADVARLCEVSDREV